MAVAFLRCPPSTEELPFYSDDEEDDDDDDEEEEEGDGEFFEGSPPSNSRGGSGSSRLFGRRMRSAADPACSFVALAAEAAGVFVSDDAGEALAEVVARLRAVRRKKQKQQNP